MSVLLATCLASGCDVDPVLGEAIDDVNTAAPKVCKDWCEEVTLCYWSTGIGEDVVVDGEELENAKVSHKETCIANCAFRADNGVYVRETDYDDPTTTYTFVEHLAGSLWTDYFRCIWDADLWECSEHGFLIIDDSTEENCVARDECHQILNISDQLEWHDGENEGCYHDGYQQVWDLWGD
jgi:hypothetical protein